MDNIYSLKKQLLKKYDTSLDFNGVSGNRLATRLDKVSRIGLTADNGSFRLGYSIEEQKAKEVIMTWMQEAELTTRIDGAGNVFGRLEGKNSEAKAILSGSHVDSVPNGGHFDGVLGVLSALEVVEGWKATGYIPEKPFEVVIFSDEEGSRFNGGLNGSEAVIGDLDMEEKCLQQDAAGKNFSEVLREVGLSVEGYASAKRNIEAMELFVELHIEQGKRLEKENLPCGIVTGIAGPAWLEFTFSGEAGHAGNTPMDDRKDASVAASEFIVEANKLPNQVNDSSVVTIGKMNVKPNAVNVIPGEVTLYVDIRDIYKDTRDVLIGRVIECAQQIASKYHIRLTHQQNLQTLPVPIAATYQKLLAQALASNGIRPFFLPSGAGHDAMVIGKKLPIAMIFVRSKGGISHNPVEWSDLNDCIQGIHVLKSFIESLQS